MANPAAWHPVRHCPGHRVATGLPVSANWQTWKRRKQTMKIRRQDISMMTGVLGVALCAGTLAIAQSNEPYGDAHQVVQQTMEDLQRAQLTDEIHGKDLQRIDQAIKHLSEFDHRIAQHHFDDDKLNSAIQAVSDVSVKNHFDQAELDTIAADANSLRRVRLQHKNSQ
jgi:hypothetical protein